MDPRTTTLADFVDRVNASFPEVRVTGGIVSLCGFVVVASSPLSRAPLMLFVYLPIR